MGPVDGGDHKHSSWGIHVVVILAFGIGLAVLGWFAAAEFGDAIESPVTATTGSDLAAP